MQLWHGYIEVRGVHAPSRPAEVTADRLAVLGLYKVGVDQMHLWNPLLVHVRAQGEKKWHKPTRESYLRSLAGKEVDVQVAFRGGELAKPIGNGTLVCPACEFEGEPDLFARDHLGLAGCPMCGCPAAHREMTTKKPNPARGKEASRA